MTWQTDLYDDMLASVMTLTNRPDLEAETKLALRSATTNAHLTDAYFRDCVSQNVQLPNSAGTVALNISTLFPQFRGLGKVRPADVNGNLIDTGSYNGNGDRNGLIEVVELGDIFDPEYKNLRYNVAYVSGDSVVIRTGLNCAGFFVDWYKAPKTKREEYDSWIAQLAPSVIWYWAAALVFSTNGDEDKARNYLAQVEKFYIPQLKQNFLVGAMR